MNNFQGFYISQTMIPDVHHFIYNEQFCIDKNTVICALRKYYYVAYGNILLPDIVTKISFHWYTKLVYGE